MPFSLASFSRRLSSRSLFYRRHPFQDILNLSQREYYASGDFLALPAYRSRGLLSIFRELLFRRFAQHTLFSGGRALLFKICMFCAFLFQGISYSHTQHTSHKAIVSPAAQLPAPPICHVGTVDSEHRRQRAAPGTLGRAPSAQERSAPASPDAQPADAQPAA